MRIHSLFQLLVVNLWLRVARLQWRNIRVGQGGWIKSRTDIGKGSGVGGCFTVRGAGSLKIGRYCAIGESVRIITSNHDMQTLSMNYLVQDRIIGKRMVATKKDVTIGHDVWIGDSTIILAGVEIGNGAVIGAGAVVSKSIPPYKIVGGNPARIIKDRFPPEVIARIESLSWWNLSEAEQQHYASLFESVYSGEE